MLLLKNTTIHNYKKKIINIIVFIKKFKQSEVTLMRTSPEESDEQFFCKTHLGHLLEPGDVVLGYDTKRMNLAEMDMPKALKDIPDVV